VDVVWKHRHRRIVGFRWTAAQPMTAAYVLDATGTIRLRTVAVGTFNNGPKAKWFESGLLPGLR